MLSDQQIMDGLRDKNPNATEKDVAAYRRFMRCFDCEDAETYDDAQERILLSMDMMSDAVDSAPNRFEAHRILRERLAKL
jgi:hypothetical protein